MAKKEFLNIESNILTIINLEQQLNGHTKIKNQDVDVSILKDNEYEIEINTHINSKRKNESCVFINDLHILNVKFLILSRNNNLQIKEGWGRHYSRGKIHEFRSVNFNAKKKSRFRSFYRVKTSHLFYTHFEDEVYATETFNSRGLLSICINNIPFSVLTYKSDFLMIESNENIDYNDYCEYCYNILISIGVISGKFIQDECYTFCMRDNEFSYRKLRNSTNSIYHALTSNSYGYKDFIGIRRADKLYKDETLKDFSPYNLSKLVELVHNNIQIQYALVLFNEAKSNQLSLLLKNNSFYVVLEVLRKYYYDIYKDKLPINYTSRKNTDKFILVFENIIHISTDDVMIINDRNLYLHGDIKDLEGQKMVDDMQKQITLIHRIILTYIGFNGYVINHYAIRNGDINNAFIKCN